MSYQAAIISTSPDGYWPLDDSSGTVAAATAGSAGVYGNSGGGTTGQRTITYSAGSITPSGGGNSVSFGGWVSGSSADQSPMATQCFAKLPTALTSATDFTIIFSFEMPNHATETQTGSGIKRPLLSINEDSNPDDRSIIKINTADLFYSLGTLFDGMSTTMSDTSVGTSHQFVMTYTTASNSHEYFLDGASIHSQTSWVNFFTELVLGNGGVNTYMGAATKYADVAYWSRKLSSTEISDLYAAFATMSSVETTVTFDYAITDPAPADDYAVYIAELNPRRWIRCRDLYVLSGYDTLFDFGSDAIDASSTSSSASNTASVIPASNSDALDTAGGRIEMHNLFATNIYTVCFWIANWPASATKYYVFGANNGAGAGAEVYIQDGNIQFSYAFWDSPFAIPAGDVLFVTITSDGTQYNLSINGQPTGVTPVSASSALLHAYINADNDAVSGADGVIYQDICAFDYVLTGQEIQHIYELGMDLVSTSTTVLSVQGSQTTAAPSTNTPPGNYCLSIQGSRREQITAQKTGSNNLHYFATAGLTTTPTSTPAGEVIPPTLRNPGNLYREINLNEFGIVKPSFGEIVIDNLGGVHDDLLSKKLDGQKATLYRGKKGAEFPGGFTQVLKSSIAGISADYNQIRLKLRDDLDFLDTPLLTKTFTGEGGIKGDSSVTGQPRSRHFLMSTYAPARLIDQSKLIYHISDNNAFDAYSAGLGSYWEDKTWFAYDGGVEIDRAGDYSTIYELENLSPDPGECRFYLNQDGGVYLRLGSPPAFDVRVKPYPVTGGGVGIDVPSQTYNISDIVNEVVPGNGAFGFTAQERIVTDNSETVAEFIADQARAFFYNVWTDRLGAIKVQRFNAFPETGSAVKTFSASEIINIQITNQIPAHKLIINSGETFPSSLATGAPAAVKDALSKTGYVKQIVSEDVTVKSSHKLSKPLQIDTKTYINASDESSIIYSYKTFFRERQYVQLDVVVNDETLALDINNTVGIEMPRLGFNTGKNFTITGVRHDFSLNRLVLTLWG